MTFLLPEKQKNFHPLSNESLCTANKLYYPHTLFRTPKKSCFRLIWRVSWLGFIQQSNLPIR